MPRPLKIDRPRRLEFNIPASIYAKMQDQLYSEVECKVPHGATSALITELVTDWLKSRGVTV
jgi:hypothetical protein